MKKTKTYFLGELLMRLDVPDQARFVQAEQFRIRYTGAELNSAVAMRMLDGENVHLITAVPSNDLGESALNWAEHWHVSTDSCIRKPGRLGILFIEQGFGVRPSQVIYDRQGSVFAVSCYEDFEFEKRFSKGDWLHVSGTLPALSPDKAQFTEQVFRLARERGCTVSLDLNYRASLWSFERASAVFKRLLKYTDVLLGNASLAKSMLQTEPEKLCRKFGLSHAALTFRKEIASDENICSAMLCSADGTCCKSREYQVKMLDRIGGGDAFAGAILYGLRNGLSPEKLIDLAEGALVLKQTVPGDFGLISRKEIEMFLANPEISVRR